MRHASLALAALAALAGCADGKVSFSGTMDNAAGTMVVAKDETLALASKSGHALAIAKPDRSFQLLTSDGTLVSVAPDGKVSVAPKAKASEAARAFKAKQEALEKEGRFSFGFEAP